MDCFCVRLLLTKYLKIRPKCVFFCQVSSHAWTEHWFIPWVYEHFHAWVVHTSEIRKNNNIKRQYYWERKCLIHMLSLYLFRYWSCSLHSNTLSILDLRLLYKKGSAASAGRSREGLTCKADNVSLHTSNLRAASALPN